MIRLLCKPCIHFSDYERLHDSGLRNQWEAFATMQGRHQMSLVHRPCIVTRQRVHCAPPAALFLSRWKGYSLQPRCECLASTQTPVTRLSASAATNATFLAAVELYIQSLLNLKHVFLSRVDLAVALECFPKNIRSRLKDCWSDVADTCMVLAHIKRAAENTRVRQSWRKLTHDMLHWRLLHSR